MAATKEQIAAVLVASGYVEARWGHCQKTLDLHGRTRQYRVKLQAHTVRVEVKSSLGDWVRFGGAFYSKVMLLEDKMIVGSLALSKPIGFNPPR